MATYTKEQNELIDEIRRVAKLNEEGGLNYEGSVYYGELLDRAKEQNICAF
jgi:hypothetical protein